MFTSFLNTLLFIYTVSTFYMLQMILHFKMEFALFVWNVLLTDWYHYVFKVFSAFRWCGFYLHIPIPTFIAASQKILSRNVGIYFSSRGDANSVWHGFCSTKCLSNTQIKEMHNDFNGAIYWSVNKCLKVIFNLCRKTGLFNFKWQDIN